MVEKFSINENIQVLAHGSISFYDPNESLQLVLSAEELGNKNYHFQFILEEKDSKKENEVPVVSREGKDRVLLKIPVDTSRKNSGATLKPVIFEGLTADGTLSLHFNINNVQRKHYILGYTFYWLQEFESRRKDGRKK